MKMKTIIPLTVRSNGRNAFEYMKDHAHYKKNRRNKEKINIVFFVNRANTWNSSKEVYRRASSRSDINTYIIVMPEFKFDHYDVNDRKNFDFISRCEEGIIIEAYDMEKNEYFDVASLDPDYIFIDTPYDETSPDMYKIDKLAGIAKLCYISYGYTMKKSNIQTVTVKPKVMRHVSYIFSCNQTMYDYYRKYMVLTELLNGTRLYNIGYPRFDVYSSLKSLKGDRTTILWLPRWKTMIDSDMKAGKNEPSTFFELKDKLPDYIEAHSETQLIARPHPFAFYNYIKQGVMTEEEAKEYQQRIERSERMELDTDPAYEKSLMRADILIADFTSMLAEYFVLDRPIIYFGNGDNYPPENIGMYNSFYHVKSWEEAEKVLDGLLAGNDPKKEQRSKAVEDFRKKMPHNVAGRIVDMLVNDYRKGK